MSCGERSCKQFGSCYKYNPDYCNVDCQGYKSNGMKPDSKHGQVFNQPYPYPIGANRAERRRIDKQRRKYG